MEQEKIPVRPVTFETGRHYRVHKSYIWVAPIMAVFVALFAVLTNGAQGLIQLFFAIQDGSLKVNIALVVVLAVLAFAVLVGVFIGLYALAWRNMSYVFDEREFSYYSGIITKRRVHVPYARVQSVNHRASIIQRLFGVCTVIVDSAGGAANKGVRVPYLRLETAERLRADLFTRKAAVETGAEVRYVAAGDTASAEGAAQEAELRRQGRAQVPAAPGTGAAGVGAGSAANVLDETVGAVGEWRGIYGGAAMDELPVKSELGLKNNELVLTALSHDAPIVTAAIIAVSLLVMGAFILLDQDEVSRVIAAFIAPFIVGIAVFGWVAGLVGVTISYGGFRVRRRGSRIEVERGLLARNFSGIDVERVQSIEVRQSFVRRLLGYCELSLGRIDAAGDAHSANNNSRMDTRGLVIHPFVKIDRVDDILDAFLPEFSDRPRHDEMQALPRPALRRAILRRCVWYNWALWTTLAIAVCWGVLAWVLTNDPTLISNVADRANYLSFLQGSLIVVVVLCVVLTAVFGVGAVLWARHSGWAWNRRYLLVHNDGLSTGTSVIPRNKIQSGATRDNPFQRRLDLTALHAVTAAGTRSTSIHLLDVPASVGVDYLEWLG